MVAIVLKQQISFPFAVIEDKVLEPKSKHRSFFPNCASCSDASECCIGMLSVRRTVSFWGAKGVQ